MASKKTTVLALALACSVLTGTAHLTIKWGVDRSHHLGWTDPLVLLALLLACSLMGVGLLALLLALRSGALSTVYPVLAARYIWVVGVTPWLFPTKTWNLYKILGAVVVAAGVSLVARAEQS